MSLVYSKAYWIGMARLQDGGVYAINGTRYPDAMITGSGNRKCVTIGIRDGEVLLGTADCNVQNMYICEDAAPPGEKAF